ncbi:uncharacterized protein LOC113389803 [Ctenocephalides felis]|uniref:uncharacterized protein LOC113389803 n=1 Tax=Ctenocephalides felis TaxID=7515 RepID=UPI000E6E496D|nr:uncharacterized protein LOC113389803 [Ctenocephalides felis]
MDEVFNSPPLNDQPSLPSIQIHLLGRQFNSPALLNHQPSSLSIHEAIQFSCTTKPPALIAFNPPSSKHLSSIYQAYSIFNSPAPLNHQPSWPLVHQTASTYRVSIRQFNSPAPLNHQPSSSIRFISPAPLNHQPSWPLVHQTIQFPCTTEPPALFAFSPSNSKHLSSIYQAIQFSCTTEPPALIAFNPSSSKHLSSIYQAGNSILVHHLTTSPHRLQSIKQ